MNQLMQRVITAVVLFAIVLFVFFRLPPAAGVIVMSLFTLLAAWEWSGFLRFDRALLRGVYVLLVFCLMTLSWVLIPRYVSLQLVFILILLWWAVAFVWVLRYPTPIGRTAAAVCGLLVIIPAWTGLVKLLARADIGPAFVLLLLMTVWAADVGAYFVGRRVGRVHLAPNVSPGKTWEGAAGGLFAAAAVAGSGAALLGLSVGITLTLGIFVGAISILGDLTVSMFKRSAGLKDSGHLFPGHGGVLDRLDSVTPAVPLFALAANWLGFFAI